MRDHAPATAIEPCGEWELANATGGHRVPMTLPCGFSALHRAGVLPDPCAGGTETARRWLSGRDWTGRRSVTIEPDCSLVVHGRDTVCEVRASGIAALRAANAFRTWRTDISSATRHGENASAIVCRSAPRADDALQARKAFCVPLHDANRLFPSGSMLRKPRCDFGWGTPDGASGDGCSGGTGAETR